MIDIQKVLSEPKGIYNYVNGLRKTLKSLTIDDESIKSDMERYKNQNIDWYGRTPDFKPYETPLMVLDYAEDYQVIRGFVRKLSDLGEVTLTEVLQTWIYMGISEENNTDKFDFSFIKPENINNKDLEPYLINMRDSWFGYGICPIGRLHPFLVRKGLTMKEFANIGIHMGDCYQFLKFILVESLAEILLKNSQIYFCKYLMFQGKSNLVDYLPQVKICSKHHYVIEDPDMWRDYVKMLNKLGKDTHNPKYICPKNLKQAHDRLAQKIQAKGLKEKTPFMIIYEYWVGRYYADIVIEDEKYIIHPIATIEDMWKEGQVMHNCVYSSGYYNKPGKSIILSCQEKVTHEHIATIECDMTTTDTNKAILQLRGPYNSEPKDYNQINFLVQQWFEEAKKTDNFKELNSLCNALPKTKTERNVGIRRIYL